MAKFWSQTFMAKMRAEWLRRIVKAQYKAGVTWYDAVITEKKIEGDTLFVTIVTQDSLSLTITGLRLIDTGGEVAGEQSDSITKKDTQGVLLQFSFPLYEAESTQKP